MDATSTDFGSDIAVLNLVRTDGRAELSHTLKDPVGVGELIVNLRAEGAPDVIIGQWTEVATTIREIIHKDRGDDQSDQNSSDDSLSRCDPPFQGGLAGKPGQLGLPGRPRS